MTKRKQTESTIAQSMGKIITMLVAGFILTATSLILIQRTAEAEDVIVYKSPTCGCCSEWIKHLEENGFSVKAEDLRNVNQIKAELGVPNKLRSCHTAKVGDYVIEGHVPAQEITRMLKEKPQVKGLAVPGMPMGSPGMEGPRQDRYDVLTFDKNGKSSVYASY